jgi:RNA polymerase sigma-70 factor (sigma-E family)
MVGSRDAADFSAFVSAQWSALFRTAVLMTGDYQRAEDLMQATLVKVYVAWPRISSMSQPGAYARKILVNQATSWWRRRSASETPVAALPDGEQPAFDDSLAESRALWDAVLALPPRQRAVIVLRYYEDLSEEEIAETLGVARGTVKGHAHTAMAALRRRLSDTHPVGAEGIHHDLR